MKVVCICILLLWPGLALAQEQYYGVTVSRILIPDPVDPADVTRVSIKVGDAITPEKVRESIEGLYGTGHYQTIEVEAAQDGAGVRLTFLGRPHSFFGSIRLNSPKLLDRPLSASIRIPLGAKFSQSPVDRIVEDTRRLLTEQGYFAATIRPEYVTDKATRLVTVSLNATAGERARIGAIQIEGGEATFSRQELLDAFDVKPGSPFSMDKMEAGIARIRQKFASLGFLNVKIQAERIYDPVSNAVRLHARVEPGRFAYINVRTPEGPPVREISKDDLRTLVPVFEEGSADAELIEEGRVRIEEFLRKLGFFDATVSSKTVEAPQDDAIQISYIADKGERRRLRTVHFEGNRYYAEADIRRVIGIHPAGLLNQGVFSRDLLQSDLRTIEALYRSEGFLDVLVDASQKEDATTHDIDLSIAINEGTPYTIGRIVVLGASAVSEWDLRAKLGFEEGENYSAAALEASRRNLLTLYSSRGFADVRIATGYERWSESTVTAVFRITEGAEYRIGDIFVSGNTITSPKTVRRNMKLNPGEPYDREALLTAQQRLYSTGLFDRVDILPLDTDVNRTRTVMIYVEDARRILLSYGFGFKEFEGPRGTFEIAHNNLWGLDRTLTARVRGGRRERSVQTSYREPHLFNHDNIQGFAGLLVEKTQRRFFNADTVDFSIQTVWPLKGQSSLVLSAGYQTVNLRDILVNPAASQFPTATGVIQISRAGIAFTRDHRRNREGLREVVDPQNGIYQTASFQLATRKLGSEVNFASLYNQLNFYLQRPNGVVVMSTRLGWKQPYGGDRDLPISERFFAGGSTSLRGFNTDELRAGGGQMLTIANLEYRKPLNFLGVPGIGAALFYDTGNVFEKAADFTIRELTHTGGAGLRYQTPFGPVRIDIGVNLHPLDRIRNDGFVRRDERLKVFLTLGNAF